jgi:hypothetical protein
MISRITETRTPSVPIQQPIRSKDAAGQENKDTTSKVGEVG